MRINRVEITGFGPYKSTQTVDFDAFADDGLFLIGGRTGAGKSSILDAICFALFDGVPRYDKTEARLRSDHCGPDDPTLVVLEFTVGDDRYRVERSPAYDRPKKRGDGTTKTPASARLAVLRRGAEGDVWEGLFARPADVGNELERVLGLSKEQFLQVVLLAQNRFQQFLLAKNDERQALLRTLFGTRRFRDYEDALAERTRVLAEGLSVTRARIDQLVAQASRRLDVELMNLESADDAAAALHRQAEEAARVATIADEAHRVAATAHEGLTATAERQRRRVAAEQRLTELDASAETIARARERLTLHRSAETVRPAVLAARAARSEAALAATALSTARAGVSHDDDRALLELERADLETHIERLLRDEGELEAITADERALPGQRDALTAAESRLTTATTTLTDALTRSEELPARLEAALERITASSVAAGRAESAAAELERCHAAARAAEMLDELLLALPAAEALELDQGRRRTAASIALDRLHERRLGGHAAELAAALVDGEACSVCGSLEHPAPAETGDDAVTESMVAAAVADLEAATRSADEARTAADALRARIGEQRVRTDGVDRATLDERVTAASRAVALAAEAAETLVTETAERDALRRELDEAEARLTALREKRDAADVEASVARAALATATDRVEQHRGEFTTVAERLRDTTRRLRALRSVAEAERREESALSALATADEALAAQLTESGFADAESVEQALLSPTDQREVEASVRAHDEGRAIAKATLADPELEGLPSEPVDVDASAAALLVSEHARDEARSARDALIERDTSVAELLSAARAAASASAEAHAEYETVATLAASLRGDTPNTKKMKLESYVLAAELEEIVAAANGRLRQMSGGRYRLEHSDALAYRKASSGLGLQVLDLHTGRPRSTHSLSGGESFLASLALALGLAEVVTGRAGGVTLDTLFIDEGFGSLDGDTLEIAMGTLDSLRAGGRTIGLISHVEAMKEQIPAKLAIDVADGGWSVIDQR
ncbi:SMC family ATPase [Agromyces atrinae]|uniref:AAA family ATPase n=1 Tax=Agromyces atrinae TaxID=592376 RepID=UPI001F5A337E|nr:SMC family ATPase [Agromyces atrinae]MCI2959241.1 SMC family ATPase [Agromyces atrinae]